MELQVVINGELLLEARRDLDPLVTDAELIEMALREMVQRRAARRLAELGGASPEMQSVRRRRGDDSDRG